MDEEKELLKLANELKDAYKKYYSIKIKKKYILKKKCILKMMFILNLMCTLKQK